MSGSRRRALGQHFLRDPGIARAIVDLAAPASSDLVIEIGPGEGALTVELARRAGSVVALEVDAALAARLRARLPGVDVREADARTWNYAAVTRPAGGRVLVIGNLPYSVSKPIVAALVAARQAFDTAVLMLQREVAERLAAAPGGRTYGALSVFTQMYADVRIAFRVPPGAFRPPPRVESAVVVLVPLDAPRLPLDDERKFHAVVRAAFGRRRKQLANALAAGLGLTPGVARAAAARAGVEPDRRAETLDLKDFVRLAASLSL